jgi:hypothetical protein
MLFHMDLHRYASVDFTQSKFTTPRRRSTSSYNNCKRVKNRLCALLHSTRSEYIGSNIWYPIVRSPCYFTC